ncbi:hypothetical protein CRE_03415 [Caenorhabditis remanei]|uniref:Serpentine receptor class r-10 n=1 Tax=Caenorhabditis remanei TaxID=31234 RepID=E3NAM0_CAERE|nr:hypothetical protein CRE_03415 [Caenorhabditis remanei]
MGAPLYIAISQHIGFFVSLLTNSLLLYLIITQAGKLFGRYRVLMICFCVYCLFYAILEMLTAPVVHIHGAGILFYVNSFLKYDFFWAMVMANAYSACFAFCMSLLANHFVFRYIAVCKSHKLYYFDGYKLYLWFIPPLTMLIAWSITIQFLYDPTDPERRDYFRNMTREVYDENIEKLAYIGPVYYTWENGKRQFRLQDLLGSMVISSIISISSTTCIVCAYKTYKKLNDLTNQMSSRTLHLNKQLFLTLGLQTLLPCFTQYIPVGLNFTLPLFEIPVGKIANLVGVTPCLYPALDPLIAIFMIDRFRNWLFQKESPSHGGSGARVHALPPANIIPDN